MERTPLFSTKRLIPLAALAVVASGLIGAGTAALLIDNSSGSTTTTVVQQAAPSAAPVDSESLSVANVYRRSSGGVVEITVTTGGSQSFPFGGGSGQAQGSGFVYDAAGHIVTNEHVVDGATSVSVRLADGSTYKATVVGTDASTDLAVIKIDAPSSKLHPLTLADSSSLAVGTPVVAIGSPFGLEGTVTAGIVSALHREIQAPNNFTIEDAIQTDAAINHGNSGGALLDLEGRVVGVTAQIKSESGGNEGVGFAIPSNTVRSVAGALISKGTVHHAYLGVSLSAQGTARIDAIRPGTPAARAGLHAGDVVTALGGKSVSTGAQLRAAIDAKQPGDAVRITVHRDGSERTFTVTLANRPD
jgi:putative serine protease PepD